MMRKVGPVALSLVWLLATPWAAQGVDGVLEINQACALQIGCFTGDAPGFPVTIDGAAGRSYRLTGDLVVPAGGNTTAIRIDATSIAIDLNGFEIIGPSCVGATSSSCRPASGSGHGIEAILGPTDSYRGAGISVGDGSITGMGSHGVLLGAQAQIRGLRLRWNGSNGIAAREGSLITGNSLLQNGNDGIVTRDGSTISDNVVLDNVRTGIQVQLGSFAGAATVSGNTAVGNHLNGISANAASSLFGNTASKNGNTGIIASTGSTVSGNTATANGGDGIVTGGDCLVERNTVRGNVGFGLILTPDTAYRSNVINDNVGGTVLNGGVNLGANSCNGTPSCP